MSTFASNIATSFFATALSLQGTFEYDYKLPHVVAWFLAGGIPFAVFLAGAKDFVAIISFSGAVFGGITAVLVALIYIAVAKQKAVKEHPLHVPLWVAYVSIVVLGLGAIYETWSGPLGICCKDAFIASRCGARQPPRQRPALVPGTKGTRTGWRRSDYL